MKTDNEDSKEELAKMEQVSSNNMLNALDDDPETAGEEGDVVKELTPI